MELFAGGVALILATWIPWLCRAMLGPISDISETVVGVAGGRVALPCDLTSPVPGDDVALVLWYKDDLATPLYSLDARRGGPLARARHAPADSLAPRAYFSTVGTPAKLELAQVVPKDEGEYRCRVDFRLARTRNRGLLLKIIEPPKKPIIKDTNGEVLEGEIGPFNEGDRLDLICEVEGGKPSPRLTWWRGSTLLDDTFQSWPSRVRNELSLSSVSRGDLHAVLSCQAANSNLSQPATTVVSLDLNFRPLSVRLEPGGRRSLSAGKPVTVSCTAEGSRPPAVILWKKAGARLAPQPYEGSPSPELVTISAIELTPSSEDHGKYLTCQAMNPRIPGSALEDSWKLDVRFVPQLSLRLGSKLRHSNIQEGKDVYFECNVRANPRVAEIGWRFEGREVHTDLRTGVIVSNQTLVLQRVRRSHRGHYICTAANSEGRSHSNPVFLRVQYPPVCKSGQPSSYGGILHWAVRVTCEVEADPSDLTFHWRFVRRDNGSGTDLVPHMSAGTRSVVNYIPRTEADFGALHCWASNPVGVQRQPCVYTVQPAGLPGAVGNCSAFPDVSRGEIHVRCEPGPDGGLVPHYFLEARPDPSGLLAANLSSDRPSFPVRTLQPGRHYHLSVFAVNARGRGPTTVLTASLPSVGSAARSAAGSEGAVSPVVVVVLALAGVLVLVAMAILLFLRRSCCRARPAPLKCLNAPQRNGTGPTKMAGPELCHISRDDEKPPLKDPACSPVNHLEMCNQNSFQQGHPRKILILQKPDLTSGPSPPGGGESPSEQGQDVAARVRLVPLRGPDEDLSPSHQDEGPRTSYDIFTESSI